MPALKLDAPMMTNPGAGRPFLFTHLAPCIQDLIEISSQVEDTWRVGLGVLSLQVELAFFV